MSEELQIKELYKDYWDYMISKDLERLRNIMSEDYYLMHMTGKSRVLAAVYGGGKNSWRLKGDFTLRKENGTWKLTSSRASTY